MKRVQRLLSLRTNEVPRLSLAALLFFLVAVDDGIVKSVASGVFNTRIGPDRLPEMYTWIAVLFSATMVLLSWLTAQLARQRFVYLLFATLTGLLTFNAVLLWSSEMGSAALLGAGFYPFLFVSSELIRNVAGFQVWIVAGGICYTSRAKVLFPLLAASTTMGDIAGGFLVRLTGPLVESFQLYGLAAVNMGLGILLLRPLMRRYFVTPAGEAGDSGATLGENLRYFGRSSYLRLLFLLSLVLFALYTAIHYGFNVVARERFPTEGEITAFFGLFFGLAGVATLVTTTVLLRHLLRWLGVANVYLWVCVVHAAVALVLGLVFHGSVVLSPVVVILVFNLLNYVLLDSVIAPTYQVLMKLVPDRHSDGTRMIMEGGFMLFGGLLGAAVTVLHARDWLQLWQLFALLLAISAAMVVAGWRLRRRYREVLVQAVREQAVDVVDEQAMRDVVAGSAEVPRGLLLHRDDGVREMGIEILRQSPAVAEEVCLPLLGHENPRIRAAAMQALARPGADGSVLVSVLPQLDDEEDEVRLGAARYLARAIEAAGGGQGLPEPVRDRVTRAVRPRLDPSETGWALQAEYLYILQTLEDAASAEARGAMLQTMLDNDQIEAITSGIDAVCRLRRVAEHPGVLRHIEHPHPAVREAAVRAVAQLGSREACTSLVAALADPDPDVVAAAIAGLESAAPAHGDHLSEGLEEAPTKQWEGLVRSLARVDSEALEARLLESCRQRLLAANRYLVVGDLLQRRGAADTDLLQDQLDLECRTVRDAAVSLLGELGDVDVVSGLVERMNDEAPGARDNAIELLENIGNSELMEPLLPLLTDDEEERLAEARRLTGFETLDLERALSCVLASPDPWTQLAGAWVARVLERADLLEALRADAPDHVKEIATPMDTDAGSHSGQHPLTNMEKITFLKESPFFAALPLEELYHIALSVQEESAATGATVIEQGSLGDKMYIVVAGQLEVRRFGDGDDEGQRVAELGDKQVFGDMALLDDEPRSASVIALSDCRLLSLQRTDLERILRRYSSIAFSMMRILSRRLRRSMAA